MEKSTLNKKIKSYSALAGTIFATSASSNAQIIYTDVNPDSTSTIINNFYNLDLNNDGTFDFTINFNLGSSSGTSQQVSITPNTSNGVAGDTVGMYVYPFALNAGDTVKASLQFNVGSNQSMGSYFGPSYAYGNWIGATNKYLGLSFYIGTNLHYGWARLDVDSTASQFTIKDYAYNAAPNAYILAGEMSSAGINEAALANRTSIYSSNKNITIKFLNTLPLTTEVKITNTLGQEIYNGIINTQETSLDLSKEKIGLYFVTIVQNNIVYTKKVHLQ